MYNAATKVFTPEERAMGIAYGKHQARYAGRPVFISWRLGPYGDSWSFSGAPPEPENDNPANGKVVTPLVPLGWVHPDWAEVPFGALPNVTSTVWPLDVPDAIRYAWGEEQRTTMQYARTEYYKRGVRAGNTIVNMWVGMARGYTGDLADYPEVTPTDALVTADV